METSQTPIPYLVHLFILNYAKREDKLKIIWFNNNEEVKSWSIGNLYDPYDPAKTKKGELYAKKESETPWDVPKNKWKYFDEDENDNEWADDVQIKCTGKIFQMCQT